MTPEMARELIVALKREKFEFVVAPYEADATIASLALTAKERGGGRFSVHGRFRSRGVRVSARSV